MSVRIYWYDKITAHFPALPKASKGFQLHIRSVGEQLAVHPCVKETLPILPRHVGHEPRKSFPVEPDLRRKSGLEQKVGCARR
jgi:hypothetical protein